MQTMAMWGLPRPAALVVDCPDEQDGGPRGRDRRSAAEVTLSRRRQYSDSTRRRLVRVARELFTENGYAATSLDAIVAGAHVTKGALYHHFDGKQALFEAVFAKVERSATKAVRRAQKRRRDPWEKATAGLRAFLEVVQTEEYRRIVMQEGPGVLGHARFREREEHSAHEILGGIVTEVLGQHADDLEPEMLETLTHVFHGALGAAGSYVADNADPQAASARVEAVIGFILLSLRHQLEVVGPTLLLDASVSAGAADVAEEAGGDQGTTDTEDGAEPTAGIADTAGVDSVDVAAQDDPDDPDDAGNDAGNGAGVDGEVDGEVESQGVAGSARRTRHARGRRRSSSAGAADRAASGETQR